MDALLLEKYKLPIYNYEPPITPSAPLTRTPHPTNPHLADEEAMVAKVRAQSEPDRPLDVTCSDPYSREPVMCILCPRRYAVPIEPDYKNPKLLAQFVSPHTGKTYAKHITGLCQHMQLKVEKEVIKAQTYGFMATMIKEAIYLKDHALFDSTRPKRKNPH